VYLLGFAAVEGFHTLLLTINAVVNFLRTILLCCALFCSGLVFAEPAEQQPKQPQNQPFSEVTFSSLVKYAQFAAAAYGDVAGFKRTCDTYHFKFSDTGANITDKVRYFIATNDEEKTQLIAVRGTSNVENAVVDIDYVLTPDEILDIELHKGFAQSSQSIYQELKPKLHKDYTIHLTGHSLGGAVAVILGMYLDKQDYKTGEIVTFGQPKVTNRSGAKRFAHLNVTRVNTAEDMVPLMPPFDVSQILNFKFDIFWHLGKEYVLLSDEYYSVLDGMDSLLRGADFLSKAPTAENLNAHRIDTYIKLLKSLAGKAVQIPYDKRDEYLNPEPTTAPSSKPQET
jgi:triacylglycerol lipase